MGALGPAGEKHLGQKHSRCKEEEHKELEEAQEEQSGHQGALLLGEGLRAGICSFLEHE